MHYPENKETQALLDKAENYLQKGLPFVVYRKPNKNEIFGIFQSSDDLHYSRNLDDEGFVFAPFDSDDTVILIQPDKILKGNFKTEDKLVNKDVVMDETGKNDHIDLVKKGMRAIENGRLQKVVLSRKIAVPVTKSKVEIFKTLLNRYANAFGYLFHHPKVGTWCGATPETLVKVQNKELHTMSLAATLPFVENQDPKWGSKEIEEQQMVSEYIGDKLAPTVERLKIDEAKSIRAGNLWHLQSEIKGDMLSNTTVKDVVKALHPTPAVCGIPIVEAKKFIQENENYRRTFYTGFLGELNLGSNGETSLFVNLRCMEIKKNTATIFVGGGITEASDPESEWIETQNKSRTMLGVL